MLMDVKYIYCGDHFAIYTNTKSLWSTPESNIMLPVKISKFKNAFSVNT